MMPTETKPHTSGAKSSSPTLASGITSVTTTQENAPPSANSIGPDDKSEKRAAEEKEAEEKKKLKQWRVLQSTFTGSFVIVVAYGLAARNMQLLFLLVLIAMAALAVGSLLGFLFAIPRVRISGNGASEDRGNSQTPSTSLEQVSDWLTKILVGAGLVELKSIGAGLSALGAEVMTHSKDDNGLAIVAIAAVILFSVMGFLVAYLWTRTEYTGIQASADQSVSERLNRIENATDTLKQGQKDLIETTSGTNQVAHEAKELANVNREILQGETKAGPQPTAPPPEMLEEQLGNYSDDIAKKIEKFRAYSVSDWRSDPGEELFPTATANSNGRRLSAMILKRFDSSLHLQLRVEAEPNSPPVTGLVTFLFHPTFGENRLDPVFARDGSATTKILSAGWFHVVAIADNGNTILKYSLRDLPNVPDWFLKD